MVGPVPPLLHMPSRRTKVKLFVIYVHSSVDFRSLSSPSQTRSHAFLPLLLIQFTRPPTSKQTKLKSRWITSALTITGERFRPRFEMPGSLATNNFTIATTKQRALFDVHVTVHRYCILLSTTNKMQHNTTFFISANALHVSGGFSAHHQELTNYTHSIGYMPAWHTYPMLCVQFLSS